MQRQSSSWAASLVPPASETSPGTRRGGLYTPEQRIRRDATRWTLVQGILAPVQFIVFLASLALVVRYLVTGTGYDIATASIVLKTAVLYLIMVTGAIWEKVVFGQYLFAPSFWWEDAFSMLVIALHTAYLIALAAGSGDSAGLMLLALAAYATYVVNAAQFIWKLRMARLQAAAAQAPALPVQSGTQAAQRSPAPRLAQSAPRPHAPLKQAPLTHVMGRS